MIAMPCAQIALLLPRVVKKRSFKTVEDQEIDIHLLRCKLIPLVQVCRPVGVGGGACRRRRM